MKISPAPTRAYRASRPLARDEYYLGAPPDVPLELELPEEEVSAEEPLLLEGLDGLVLLEELDGLLGLDGLPELDGLLLMLLPVAVLPVSLLRCVQAPVEARAAARRAM
jgi:hypothetical protein